MPVRTSYAHGVPSWVDLSTPDIDASIAFYEALLGWETGESAPDTGGYRMFLRDGHMVAGVMPMMEDGFPAWSTYVNVDDADAVVARAKEAGGTVIVEPMDVMSAGRMAFFTDPSGAAIGVWQPGEHTGAGLVNEPGGLCWNELNTRDIPAASAFYEAVFGWEISPMNGPVDMEYYEAKVGGETIAGILPMPEMVPAEVPSFWMVYFAVDDCDAAAAQVTELGGSVVVPSMTVPAGTFAVAQDPNGTTFSVIALSGAM